MHLSHLVMLMGILSLFNAMDSSTNAGVLINKGNTSREVKLKITSDRIVLFIVSFILCFLTTKFKH